MYIVIFSGVMDSQERSCTFDYLSGVGLNPGSNTGHSVSSSSLPDSAAAFTDPSVTGVEGLGAGVLGEPLGTADAQAYSEAWSALTSGQVPGFNAAFPTWSGSLPESANMYATSAGGAAGPTQHIRSHLEDYTPYDQYLQSRGSNNEPVSLGNSNSKFYPEPAASTASPLTADILRGYHSAASVAQSGRNLYAQSFNLWSSADHSQNENSEYDLFGQQTNAVPERSQKVEQSQTIPMKQSTNSQPVFSPANTSQKAPEQLNMKTPPLSKPSYSDVTKNRPAPVESQPVENPNSQAAKDDYGLLQKDCGFPNYPGVRCAFRRPRSKSFTPKATVNKTTPSQSPKPPPIDPGSRYGLDTFDSPLPSRDMYLGVKLGEEQDTKTTFTSSKENPSTSICHESIRSSTRMEEDIGKSGGIPEGSSALSESNSSDTSHVKSEGAYNPAAGDSASVTNHDRRKSFPTSSITSTQANNSKKSAAKEKLFFDPKRIFEKQKSKDSDPPMGRGPSPESVKPTQPDHQFATANKPARGNKNFSHEPKPRMDNVPRKNVLNNDKPKSGAGTASSATGINKSCYINNDLRESAARKQNNTDRHSGSSRKDGQSEWQFPGSQLPGENTRSSSRISSQSNIPRAYPTNKKPRNPESRRSEGKVDQPEVNFALGMCAPLSLFIVVNLVIKATPRASRRYLYSVYSVSETVMAALSWLSPMVLLVFCLNTGLVRKYQMTSVHLSVAQNCHLRKLGK